MNDPPSIRARLWRLAYGSLVHGAKTGGVLQVDLSEWPEAARAPTATFVTLEANGALRGCMGALEAQRPLPQDVAENAFAAGFRDPRFSPVTATLIPQLTITLSILSPPEPLPVYEESDVIQALRPGRDGLILSEGERRATFLPSVWHDLPDPSDFLRQLKLKGGWPASYWSKQMRVWRYTTDLIKAP